MGHSKPDDDEGAGGGVGEADGAAHGPSTMRAALFSEGN